MGCCCINGFYSNIPIVEGDDCFSLLCLFDNKALETFDYGAGFIAIPICLPLFGKYNDYGSIEKVINDKNTEILESLSNSNIDELLYSINYEDKTLNDVFPQFANETNKDKKLVLAIDHKFIYDEIVKIDTHINFEQSYKLTLEADKEYKKIYNKDFYQSNDFVEGKYDNKIFIEYSSLWCFVKKKYGAEKDYFNPTINISPYYLPSFVNRELSDDFLRLYQRNGEDIILLKEIKDSYIKFLSFYYNCNFLSIRIIPNVRSSQNGIEDRNKLASLFKAKYDFIVKSLDN